MPNNLKPQKKLPGLPKLKIKEGKIAKEGIVMEALPNTNFKVKLAEGQEIQAMLSGKMRQAYIRVSLGDEVVVELNEDEEISSNTKGRIIFRKR